MIMDDLECMNSGQGECSGDTVWRESLSGTGTPMRRCDGHHSERLQLQRRLVRDYGPPDYDHAPSWFDPTYAGESW